LWWRKEIASVLPSGVDPRVFAPEPRDDARRKLGWDDTDRVVLFNSGHDVLIKRLDLAKAAFEKARRRVPALRMEILDGKIRPALLPDLMNAADCLLLTSECEGSPTVAQEALACGLPIVSVEVGDIVERLEGVDASTVASPDAATLAIAIQSMVDPPRRSNGREKIGEFSSQQIASRLKEIYEEIRKN
jgi:glycosyltransferase involved in cell wall biosynthesis